jgi:arylsulfatase A-like enzyme
MPTILDALGIPHPQPAYATDGRSLMPIIDNEDFTRDKEIGIMFNTRIVWHKGDFKLLSYDGGKKYKLYNLVNDPSEKLDVAAKKPELVEKLKKDMLAWHESVKSSYEGSEYGTKSLDRLGKSWSSPLSTKAKKTKSKKEKK